MIRYKSNEESLAGRNGINTIHYNGTLVSHQPSKSRKRNRLLQKDLGSLFMTLLILVIGIVVLVLSNGDFQKVGKYLLSCGLFGFVAGFTSWLAMRMLFSRLPITFRSCSVVPQNVNTTKARIKQAIMNGVLDETFLVQYVHKVKSSGECSSSETNSKSQEISLQRELVHKVLDEKMDQFEKDSSDFDVSALRPVVAMALQELFVNRNVLLQRTLMAPSQTVNIARLREEIGVMLEAKMAALTECQLTDAFHTVLFPEFGLVTVFSCLLGSSIGLICQASGVAPNY